MLRLIVSHPTQGLDSDKDSIPDFVEILRGSLSNLNDNLADPDHDGILNQEEHARGSNPLYFDADFNPAWTINSSAAKIDDPGCADEFWKIDVSHFPIALNFAYDEVPALASDMDLRHAKDENMILTAIKIRPKPGQPGNPKMYFNLSRLSKNQQLKLSTGDFYCRRGD